MPNAFAAGAAWIDGAVVPIAEARIPITDWGFLRGDATYDVAHVWDGRFFRLDDHLARFRAGVERLRYVLPVSFGDLPALLQGLVDRTELPNAYVAMIATRGSPAPGSRDPRRCRNNLYAYAIPFVWIADPAKQKEGVRMAISDVERIPPSAVDPRVKNYHWLDFQVALLQAYDAGYENTVLADRDGNICEGPGFNIFAVSGQTVVTPDSGMLEGITRKTVMELAGPLGFRMEVRPLGRAELKAADEILITSTAGGVMPVTWLDGCPVGDGVPGAAFHAFHGAYWAMHKA